jgi:hypothetical protein
MTLVPTLARQIRAEKVGWAKGVSGTFSGSPIPSIPSADAIPLNNRLAPSPIPGGGGMPQPYNTGGAPLDLLHSAAGSVLIVCWWLLVLRGAHLIVKW